MKEFRTTEIKAVGAFFLVAGLFGLFTFLGLIFPLDNFVGFLNLFPTALYGLTVYSGYLLLFKEDIKGLEIGRGVIIIQLINFHIAGLGYLFVTGAYIFVGFTNLNFALNFGLENTFLINLSDDTSNVVFRVNILALAIFIYLTRVMNKIHEKEEFQEVIKNQKSDVENKD
ncbi:MAG: hypothetical protein AAGF85_22290 [Bacteroidota bacterium]